MMKCPTIGMHRRAVLIGLASTFLSSVGHAQKPPTGPVRIGWLSALSEPDPFLDAFRDGLRDLGYVEGRNLVIERRYANGSVETLEAHATELVQANVALIVASLTAVRGARAIKDIPVVFIISGDPIEAGMVKSLARPGGKSLRSLSDAAGLCRSTLQMRMPGPVSA